MRLLLAAVLLAAAGMACAQDWLVVNGLVQHLSGNGYCNPHITKGLGYEHAEGSIRYAVGWYDNSNCRISVYAAAAWLPFRLADWRVGVIGGGVTGYRSSVTPAGGLAISYERERYGVNVIGIPPISASSPGVIWLQGKLRW